MILFTVFAYLSVISLGLLLLCFIWKWDDSLSLTFITLLMVGMVGMIISAGVVISDAKQTEYPLSEYDCKIKVVEFEEHRDTILVVTPKEEKNGTE